MRHDLGRLHGRAAWITVSLILLVFLTRLPRSVNLFIAILIIGGWSMWGVRWLVARFGRKVLLVLSIVVFIVVFPRGAVRTFSGNLE